MWKQLEYRAASKVISNEAVLVSRFGSSVAIATGSNTRNFSGRQEDLTSKICD